MIELPLYLNSISRFIVPKRSTSKYIGFRSGFEIKKKRKTISCPHGQALGVIFKYFFLEKLLCYKAVWLHLSFLSLSRATADEVPLGEPLSDTVLDVRDEEGQSIESGLGQLHIGEAN